MPHLIDFDNDRFAAWLRLGLLLTGILANPVEHRLGRDIEELADAIHRKTTDVKPDGEQLDAKGHAAWHMHDVFGELIPAGLTLLFGNASDAAVFDDVGAATFDT